MIENSVKTQFFDKTSTDRNLIKNTFLTTTQDAFNEAIKVKIKINETFYIKYINNIYLNINQ